MKKFILSLFFVIFALFNVCGEDVKGEIILPKIERKFVDYDVQNPLKATNVEGIFIINPYKGDERCINNKGYRIFVLDKNSNELLYIIEDVVIDWHPNHNRGWGGRVVEDDFCLLTKECVEYIIKGDKFDCEVHSYLEGKYLTEDGEDLLHPVIRDDIDEDIKKIEQALVDYALYPEMVERGFDVHRLDNMKIDGKMFEYIESFFRPNEEKGWVALDNHHDLKIKDENGKEYRSQSYHKHIKFSNEYGTKNELLKKGYVENETMFYYPSNGEKDWRVGEWSWGYYKKGEWHWSDSSSNINFNLEGFNEIDDGLSILETKKSYIIRNNGWITSSFNKNITYFPKKEYLIIDLLSCQGGNPKEALKFAESIKKSKFKKILILTANTSSAGEDLVYFLKDDKRVIYIGSNTNGCWEGADIKLTHSERFSLNLATIDYPSVEGMLEGVGFLPDIWATTKEDIYKNIIFITDDTELVLSNVWRR